MKLGDISVKLAGQYSYRKYKYGTLYFSANGENHKLAYIAEVETVQDIIVKIKNEYTQYIYEKRKRELLEKTQLAEARQQEPVLKTEQQTAEPALPEQIILIEEPEQAEQFEEFEEPEQTSEAQTSEQPQLSEIADNKNCPTCPIYPIFPTN